MVSTSSRSAAGTGCCSVIQIQIPADKILGNLQLPAKKHCNSLNSAYFFSGCTRKTKQGEEELSLPWVITAEVFQCQENIPGQTERKFCMISNKTLAACTETFLLPSLCRHTKAPRHLPRSAEPTLYQQTQSSSINP